MRYSPSNIDRVVIRHHMRHRYNRRGGSRNIQWVHHTLQATLSLASSLGSDEGQGLSAGRLKEHSTICLICYIDWVANLKGLRHQKKRCYINPCQGQCALKIQWVHCLCWKHEVFEIQVRSGIRDCVPTTKKNDTDVAPKLIWSHILVSSL